MEPSKQFTACRGPEAHSHGGVGALVFKGGLSLDSKTACCPGQPHLLWQHLAAALKWLDRMECLASSALLALSQSPLSPAPCTN